MKYAKRFIAYSLLGLLAACAAISVGSDFSAGRRALLGNDPETALGYFLAAAQRDPNYVFIGSNFKQGIWSYVGRTQYLTKRYKEARESLDRALSQDPNEYMAQLYRGLTLARSGDLSGGVKDIQVAMKGIFDFLEYMERARPFYAIWDPLRAMRKSIDNDLKKIDGKDFNPEELMANAEWLGKTMENEIDRVRQDERRQFERDFDRRGGSSVGVGIGF
jgi:tetratricopeptide (TPR) repeat protein